MRIEGKEYRTIWFENNVVKIIDQTKLPHQFIIKELNKKEVFKISLYKKGNMSNGYDDIDYLLNKKEDISRFANKFIF